MPNAEVRVLGLTTMLVAGESIKLTPVERNLLALLVAAGPVGATTDQLADGLWEDLLPDTWRASLRNTISRLNRKVRSRLAPTGRDADLISGRTSVRRLQLDTDQIDAWHLIDWAGGRMAVDSPGDRAHLLSGTPFSGCEIPEPVRAYIDQLEAARLDIVTAWDANQTRVPAQTLAAVRQLVVDNPFDQRLAVMAMRLHLLVGDRAGATTVVATVERELASNRRSLSPPLRELKRRLDGDDPTLWAPDAAGATTPTGPARAPSTGGLRRSKPLRSSALTRLALNDMVGRDDLLERLVDQLGPGATSDQQRTLGALLVGPAGVGKTRLAVETALRLQTEGFNTIYLVADNNSFGPLQPFLQSLRFLQPIVEPYLTRLKDPEVATRCWTVVLQAIEAAIHPGPTCLVADDVHWFDEHSQSLLLSLGRAELSSPLSIVVAGRQSDEGALWPSWVDEFSRAGATPVDVEPLDEWAIVNLINTRPGLRPERGRQSILGQLHNDRLAQLISDLSSGVPQVALWLLDQHERYWSGDAPSSPVFDLKDRPGRAMPQGAGYAVMIDRLAPELIEVGAVASVLGMHFTADQLTTLLGVDFERCVSRLDDLVDRQLLTTTTPGEYGFFHILVAEAFNHHLSASRRRSLHRQAYLLSDQTHARARHAANSVPVTPAVDAAKALTASARDRFASGNYVSSWAAWQRAIELYPEAIDLVDAITALESADRAGFDTSRDRERTVARALANDRPDLAVRAAVSGLPTTELIQGDIDRVRAIRMIEPDLLDHEHRMLWRCHLSRQLVWLGEMDEARTLARQAYESARTPDDRAGGWLALKLATNWSHNDVALDGLTWVDDVIDRELKAEVVRGTNVARIVMGQSRSHHHLFDRQLETARAERSPLGEWFALVQQATVLTDQGRRDQACALSEQALDLGLRTGIRAAYGVYETQRVGWTIPVGRLADRLEHVESLAAADTPNPIQLAVVAACRMAAGHRHPGLRREAVNLAGELAKVVADGPFAPAVAGLMTDVVGASGDMELIRWAEHSLEPLRGHHVVVASAIINLGPCHGLLARLTSDRDERRRLLESALDEADEQRLALWQVTGRLHLARHLGPGRDRDRLLDEVAALATTPWLQEIEQRHRDGESGQDDGRA